MSFPFGNHIIVPRADMEDLDESIEVATQALDEYEHSMQDLDKLRHGVGVLVLAARKAIAYSPLEYAEPKPDQGMSREEAERQTELNWNTDMGR